MCTCTGTGTDTGTHVCVVVQIQVHVYVYWYRYICTNASAPSDSVFHALCINWLTYVYWYRSCTCVFIIGHVAIVCQWLQHMIHLVGPS